MVPNIESGNMLAKNLAYFAKADGAGIVLGARVPIVLTSPDTRRGPASASSAVATLYAAARRRSDSHGVMAMDTVLHRDPAYKRRVPGVAVNGEGRLSREIKGQVNGIRSHPVARHGGTAIPWPTAPIRSRKRSGRSAALVLASTTWLREDCS